MEHLRAALVVVTHCKVSLCSSLVKRFFVSCKANICKRSEKNTSGDKHHLLVMKGAAVTGYFYTYMTLNVMIFGRVGVNYKSLPSPRLPEAVD